jgi:hypothetical protein
MSTPSFATEAALAGNYPSFRFNQRERKLMASVKAYLDAGISTAQIAAGAVTLAKLAAGVTPSHVIKYAGSFTTLGGDASETITVTGAAATDIVVVTVKTAGATPRSVVAAAAALNSIAVTMSGDPSTDHVLYYHVLRAAS